MGFKLKTAPTTEPISLAEAKLHLKVDTDLTADDNLITALITAARQMAENYTGLALINQTWEYATDQFTDSQIPLRPAPLSSIASITYKDSANVTQTLSSSVYEANTYEMPGKVMLKYNQVWPTTLLIENSILITFVAGYGTASSSVPAAIRAAILLIIGHLYEHRENVVIGTISSELPQGAEYLLNPYRVIEF